MGDKRHRIEAKHPADDPEHERAEFRYVNRSVPRRDAYEKVTGRAVYTSDITLPNMVHAAVVRSDIAHGQILRVHTREAEMHDGVLAVLTGDDAIQLPNPYYGHIFRDHPLLAIGRVRYAGEPVAVVVAETERAAQAAAADVWVDYETLPAALSIRDAIGPDSLPIHEGEMATGEFSGIEYGHDVRSRYSNNICHHNHLEWGNVDDAWSQCAHIYEHDYRFPLAYAYAMEPYVAVADYRSSRLSVISSCQHPYMVRHDLSKVFDLPLNRVNVEIPFVGGGYGSKSYTKIEPLVAFCSLKVGRPVRLAYSVEEAIFTTRVAAAEMHFKTGVDDQGRMVAREVEMLFDGGAYAENGPLGAFQAAERAIGPCNIPNVRVDSYLVYTNTAPSSSFRGFTATQPTFASESQLDEIAEDLGLTPLEMRLRNTAERGAEFIPGARPMDGDLREDLRMVAAAMPLRVRDANDPTFVGQGIAMMILTGGAKPVSLAQVRVHGDGSVTIYTGTTELGQGSETVLCQIVAEELEVPFDHVHIAPRSTAHGPFDRSTGASRSTTLQGRALINACDAVKSRLRGMLSEVVEVDERDIQPAPGGFQIDGIGWSYGDVLSAFYDVPEADVLGEGHVRPSGDFALTPAFWESSSIGVTVVVDPETGRITWDNLTVVADIGLAINPAMAAGQDLGGAVQGAGAALWEELRYDGDHLATSSLATYRIPRFSDIPIEATLLVAERRDGTGPYGAKGAGEGPVAAIAPALVNAVSDATGVRIRELPMTPERVWRALQSRKPERDDTVLKSGDLTKQAASVEHT